MEVLTKSLAVAGAAAAGALYTYLRGPKPIVEKPTAEPVHAPNLRLRGGGASDPEGVMNVIINFAAAQSIRAVLGSLAIGAYIVGKPLILTVPPADWLLGFAIDIFVGATCLPVVNLVKTKPTPKTWGLFCAWWVLSGTDHLEAAWLSSSVPYAAVPWLGLTKSTFILVPSFIFLGHLALLPSLLFGKESLAYFGVKDD